MQDYNKTIFMGNLGRDPEMRYTPQGKPVTSFSVASNRQYVNANGETVQVTTWFRVITWGKRAEVCHQYLKKGAKVLVEGVLEPDKSTGGPRLWQKQDGSWGAQFEVTANEVKFLSSETHVSEAGDDGRKPSRPGDFPEMNQAANEDDIPF